MLICGGSGHSPPAQLCSSACSSRYSIQSDWIEEMGLAFVNSRIAEGVMSRPRAVGVFSFAARRTYEATSGQRQASQIQGASIPFPRPRPRPFSGSEGPAADPDEVEVRAPSSAAVEAGAVELLDGPSAVEGVSKPPGRGTGGAPLQTQQPVPMTAQCPAKAHTCARARLRASTCPPWRHATGCLPRKVTLESALGQAQENLFLP